MEYLETDIEWYRREYQLVDENRLGVLLDCVNKHLEDFPNDAKAYHRKAGILWGLARGNVKESFKGYTHELVEGAIECFGKSLELDPDLYNGADVQNRDNCIICLARCSY